MSVIVCNKHPNKRKLNQTQITSLNSKNVNFQIMVFFLKKFILTASDFGVRVNNNCESDFSALLMLC